MGKAWPGSEVTEPPERPSEPLEFPSEPQEISHFREAAITASGLVPDLS